MKLSEVYKDSYVPQRVAVVGLPGTGKSTLVAMLAEKFNLIWIDIEHGSETLLKLPTAWQERVNLIKLPDSATYPIAADTLASLMRSYKGKICYEHSKFGCALCQKVPTAKWEEVDFTTLGKDDVVVIDSGTQWSNSILSHIMKGKPVEAKPERDDWGALRKHTENALSQIQAAPFNLVVIFHAQEAEMEDGRKKLVPTFGSASMSTEVAKAFGHVIYTEIKNRKHVAYSSSIALPNVLTKSRLDFEIEALPIPSLIPIFDGSIKPKELVSPTAVQNSPAQNAVKNLQTMIKKP